MGRQLQGREAAGGPTGRVWFRQDVEDLVGAAADEMEAVEGEGRPSTIANQPFQALPVGGLDADASIKTEPAAVIPAEHVLSVVGFQEAVAAKVAEDPASDRVLETLQKLMGEGGGFVEAEVGFWMGETRIRVSLDLLEEPVHYAQMEMVVRIEAGAEAMEKAHGPHGCGLRGRGAGFFESSRQGPKQDMKDGAGGLGSVMKVGAQTFGNREHHLAHRHVGNDVVHQVGCGLGHALGPARGTNSSTLAGKSHQEVVSAG